MKNIKRDLWLLINSFHDVKRTYTKIKNWMCYRKHDLKIGDVIKFVGSQNRDFFNNCKKDGFGKIKEIKTDTRKGVYFLIEIIGEDDYYVVRADKVERKATKNEKFNYYMRVK